MRKDIIRADARSQHTAGPATPERPVAAAAPEPEIRGLTRDELRRIVLDIIG